MGWEFIDIDESFAGVVGVRDQVAVRDLRQFFSQRIGLAGYGGSVPGVDGGEFTVELQGHNVIAGHGGIFVIKGAEII